MSDVRRNSMPRTEKPWGHELLVECTDKYALKEILIKKGTRSSLQSHVKKLETIFVISGSLELQTVDEHKLESKEIYRAGEAYTIRPGLIHRVLAVEDVRVIEVSTPELDDVIRYDDDFGRASS